MQFHPNAEQRDLAASLEDAICALLPITRWHEQRHESAATWDGLIEYGVFDMARPEADGGLGLGAAEEILIALNLGRQLASPAVFATLASAHATPTARQPSSDPLRFHTAATQQLDRVSIAHDPAAQALILSSASGAAVYRMPATSEAVAGNPWIDDLRHVGELGEEIAHFDAKGLARYRLIWAAALAGLADGALQMAVSYAQIREQFGRPIGSFQAVKHHCANMLVASRNAGDLVTFAATAIDEGRADANFLTESAVIVAAEAASRNAALNIQVHGGIGFSSEAEPHLYAKRAQILTALAGGSEAMLQQLSAPILTNAA